MNDASCLRLNWSVDVTPITRPSGSHEPINFYRHHILLGPAVTIEMQVQQTWTQQLK
jgi:hypothetical protein